MKKFNNQTFIPIYHSLLRQPNLTDADKIAISCILTWTENDKDCFMGNDYLGQLMGISRPAASKRINRLKSLGIIEVRMTYKKGKKEVDKRIININNHFLRILEVSTNGIEDTPMGIWVPNSETYVSTEVGGIIKDIKKDIRKEIKKEDNIEHQYTGENGISFLKYQYHVQTMLVKCFPRARTENHIFDAIQSTNDYAIKLIAGEELNPDQIRWVEEYKKIISHPNFERSDTDDSGIQSSRPNSGGWGEQEKGILNQERSDTDDSVIQSSRPNFGG